MKLGYLPTTTTSKSVTSLAMIGIVDANLTCY